MPMLRASSSAKSDLNFNLSYISRSLLILLSIAIIGLAVISYSPLQAQESAQTTQAPHALGTQPLITQAIDESQLTVLKGNVHALAKPVFDIGTAPATLPMERMLLVLKRSPEQEYALRTLLDNQQDKHSPNYHKWLTPEQFGKQFGPTDSDIQIITTWLQSHGFQVGTTKGRTVLEFSGSASQVQEAFHTTIHKYVVNGEQHWANATNPSIPTALTPAVTGVLTLHNFLKQPQIHLANQRVPFKKSKGSKYPEADLSGGLHALVPADYAVIYNAPTGLDGTGITIAIVARSDLYNGGSDVSDFDSTFGLPGGNLNVLLNGPDPGDLGGGEELEATLDSSWSGALATGSQIDFVISASTNDTDGVDLSEVYIIENNLGSLMSESFGACEAEITSSEAQGESLLAEQAAAQGITYTVSAGDTGAEGCDNLSETVATGPVSVSDIGSTPFNISVGGTLFNETAGGGTDATYWNSTNSSVGESALSYIPEDVWNETCTTSCQDGQPPLAAGGGGVSQFNAKPSWQSTSITGVPNDGFRDVPDVALTSAGHDPYLLCLEGSCEQDEVALVYGTSAASPSFAGILALVYENMVTVQGASGARQGQADYVLYPLAKAQQTAGTACNASDTPLPNSACVFNDVTVGNNSVPGETGYPDGVYDSTVGYDQASGLGSVNISNLVTAWANATFNATTTSLKLNNAVTPITIAHGTSVNVSISVHANTGTPSGDVSLIAHTGSQGTEGVPPTIGFGGGVFTLAAGTAAGTTTNLPGGAYDVTAHYEGNGTYASSDSAAPGISLTVNPETSTTALVGPFTTNPQTGQYTTSFSTTPFGSPVLLSADVSGASGQGIPTGTVTFSTTSGTIPNSATSTLNSIAVASLISNPFLVNGPTNPFDAGTYTISASYGGDASFHTSSSTSPITFTIQPGFVAVSGLAPVSISSPGLSGSTTVGFLTSTGFNTAVSFTCSSGLPTGAACTSAAVTGDGPTTLATASINVTTTAATTAQSSRRSSYLVAMLGGLPLAGIFLLAAPKRRRWSTLLGLMMLAMLMMVPACGGGGNKGGGGGGSPGTPTGTYTVTVTGTAGSLSQTIGSFTLTVQ
jgi:Pro-kumamolisin, activation domain/Bacterial Ig-like domain (group 3)